MDHTFNKWLEDRDVNEGWFGDKWNQTGGVKRGAQRVLGNVPAAQDPRMPKSLGRFTREVGPFPAQTPATAPGRVSFGRNDLMGIKVAISDYLGIIHNYVNYVAKALSGKTSGEGLSSSFQTTVSPAYNKLNQWKKWIDNMIAQANAASAVREQVEEILLEAIKVNYKQFQAMQQDMMALTNSIKDWVRNISRVDPNVAKDLQSKYVQYVFSKQKNLGEKLMWMEKKLQQLMQTHNRPYQGLSGGMRDTVQFGPEA